MTRNWSVGKPEIVIASDKIGHIDDRLSNRGHYVLRVNDDITLWLCQNQMDYDYPTLKQFSIFDDLPTPSLIFRNEEHAVAFKMRWL